MRCSPAWSISTSNTDSRADALTHAPREPFHAYAAERRRFFPLCAARVRAAFIAASWRTFGPLVRTARRAAARRSEAGRRRAARLACRESAAGEAAVCPSCLSAARIARDRRADGRRDPFLAARLADAADALVRAVALFGGGGSFTPERRALDKPMAIACLVERAPCFPSRM